MIAMTQFQITRLFIASEEYVLLKLLFCFISTY